MTESLKDLLSGRNFAEPEEVVVIKKFLHDNFQADCSVTVRPRNIVINVTSASLAGALRMRLHELQELCKTDKRLTIRIN